MSDLLDRLRSLRDDLLDVDMPGAADILEARIVEEELWAERDAAKAASKPAGPPLPTVDVPVIADANCPADRAYGVVYPPPWPEQCRMDGGPMVGLGDYVAALITEAGGRIAASLAAPAPAGYRCMECSTISPDGSAHADGCGQPGRDAQASRERWNDELASYIPMPGQPAFKYARVDIEKPTADDLATAAQLREQLAAATAELDALKQSHATQLQVTVTARQAVADFVIRCARATEKLSAARLALVTCCNETDWCPACGVHPSVEAHRVDCAVIS